jgi:predicted nucleic acid-binding protein
MMMETDWHHERVQKAAEKHLLELSEEDFERFYKLSQTDNDVEWIMGKMSMFGMSFTDALVSYVTY